MTIEHEVEKLAIGMEAARQRKRLSKMPPALAYVVKAILVAQTAEVPARMLARTLLDTVVSIVQATPDPDYSADQVMQYLVEQFVLAGLIKPDEGGQQF